jgi:hypothetical protein
LAAVGSQELPVLLSALELQASSVQLAYSLSATEPRVSLAQLAFPA